MTRARLSAPLILLTFVVSVSLPSLLFSQDEPDPDPGVGFVTALVGNAEVIRNSQPAAVISVDESVFRLDVLETAAESLLEIALNDGSRFTLDELSSVAIAEYIFDTESQGLLSLLKGRLRSKVSTLFSSRRESFKVQTNEGVMGVQGTLFDVIASTDETTVYVWEGVVSVTHVDPRFPEVQILQAGETVRFRIDEPVPPPSKIADIPGPERPPMLTFAPMITAFVLPLDSSADTPGADVPDAGAPPTSVPVPETDVPTPTPDNTGSAPDVDHQPTDPSGSRPDEPRPLPDPSTDVPEADLKPSDPSSSRPPPDSTANVPPMDQTAPDRPPLVPGSKVPWAEECDILAPARPSTAMEPVLVGSQKEVGAEGFVEKQAENAVKGVLSSLLGGSRRSSGSKMPKTRRDPSRKQDFIELNNPELDTQLGVRSKWTDDGLLVSTIIEKTPHKGTFQSIFLEDCAGRRLGPASLEIYKTWSKATLTVSWTKTNYVNGRVVGRQSGGWSQSWENVRILDTSGKPEELPSEIPAIWQQAGFGRAHAGVRQVGAYFNISPQEVEQLGTLALVVHVTRPGQDPVVTTPLSVLLKPGNDKVPALSLPPVAGN